MWVLDDESFVGTHFRSDDYNKPPYNRYTIIRAQFDKWFSSKVREAGALLICETTVSELLVDGNRVVGVRCDREGGDIFADVVILADGVNSTLARKAGFHAEISPGNVALAVKEILFMPQEAIEARFNITEDEGVVIEAIGKQDFAIVRTMVFVGSVLYIATYILIDLAYTWVDPRVRLA